MKKLSPEHRAKVIRSLKRGKADKNGNWKGGVSYRGGYRIILLRDHPNAHPNGYYPEHRLVMERKLGRILIREEIVHHINGNKLDNRPENLFLTTHHEHGKHHWDNPEMKKKQSDFMKRTRKEKFWSTKKKVANN